MPSSNHLSTLARQWEILQLLPSRMPGRTITEIHQQLIEKGHEVTRRTVERDVEGLSEVFPMGCNDRSKPWGWYLLPTAKTDLPGMALAEAVSLGLMEDLLRQVAPSHFTRALESRFSRADAILAEMPHNRNARWTDLVRYLPPGLPLQKPLIEDSVMEIVQQALLEKRQIEVDYLPAESGKTSVRTLHPLALILQGERPYLLATTFKYQDVRYYAMQRIKRAAVLDAPAKRPPGFTLDRYLAQGGGQFGQGETVTLKAKVSPELTRLLEETPLSNDQKITSRAGVHTLTATVRRSWQLDFWIRSQGPSITVMQPASLRKSIISDLEELLKNYRQ